MSGDKLRLSHSASTCYQTCPKKYYYRYKAKIREKTSSGALIFGSAMDGSLNTLLEHKKANKVQDLGYYKLLFETNWINAEINKKKVELPFSSLIAYSQSDFDGDLLTEEDLAEIDLAAGNLVPDRLEMDPQAMSVYDYYNKIKKGSGIEGLAPNQASFVNFVNWLSMKRKGLIMVEGFYKNILPRIKEVLEVQRKITLTNSEGDTVIGFVDFIAVWEDGRTVVFDNKTSSIEYEKDAVKTSGQLSLYVYECFEQYKTRTAGYIVMRKRIDKNKVKTCSQCKNKNPTKAKTCDATVNGSRCKGEWVETIKPTCRIDILIDEIPEQTESIVLENYDDILQMIKEEYYPRNFNSCILPWGRCEFWGLCYKNSMDGLETVE